MFLYIIGILVVVNYELFNKKQKIMILYFLSYGLLSTTNVSKLESFLLLIFGLFVYEEFLSDDKAKYKYVVGVFDRIKDFLFMYICVYKIGYVAFSFYLYDKNMVIMGYVLPTLFSIKIETIGSIMLMLVACLRIYEERIEFNDFCDVERILKKYPYYMFKRDIDKYGRTLLDKLHLVSAIEDKTFFMRNNGYSIISMDFFISWVQSKKKNAKSNYRKPRRSVRLSIILKRIYRNVFSWLKSGNRIRRLITKTKKIVASIYLKKCEAIRRKKRRYLRGYSTIEMQIMRVLGIERGFYTGRHHKELYKIHCVVIRKIYELVYTDMFFRNLKREQETVNDISFYREYIIFIYLHVVSTKLNCKRYDTVSDVFSNADVIYWPNEALFVATLGLTYGWINDDRIKLYKNVIDEYCLDGDIIFELLDNMNRNQSVG